TRQERTAYVLDALAAGEEGFVLEGHLLEAVALPKLGQLRGHALGGEAEPTPVVHVRVGAEGAPEPAAYRRDVIELPPAFAGEVALNWHQVVVVAGQRVHIASGPGGVAHD